MVPNTQAELPSASGATIAQATGVTGSLVWKDANIKTTFIQPPTGVLCRDVDVSDTSQGRDEAEEPDVPWAVGRRRPQFVKIACVQEGSQFACKVAVRHLPK